MKKNFENEMERGRVLVYGVAENDDIKQRIAAIYNEERIAEGMALYEKAREASNKQKLEQIESSEASRQYNDAQSEIHNTLIKIRAAGRYFFKNEMELATLLRLNMEVPTTYAEWKTLAQDTLSAVKAHDVIATKMQLADITAESTDQMQTRLDELDTLKLKAEKKDGEAQQATVAKQESFDAFMAYCSDLRECLDLFYSGNERQKLEEVGIVVKR